MKITCIDKEIRQILASDFYVIPRFQRPYSWTKENIEEFWNDVVVESEGNHFIGSVVVYSSSTGKLGIVDGQQRLTTITITLASLRNAFAENNLKKLANGIHHFVERKDLSDDSQYVLQTESSYPYFQEHIQKFDQAEIALNPGPEENLLGEAYSLLTQKIRATIEAISHNPSISQKKKAENIENELTKIRDRILSIKLIFIELDDENDAYFVFETLNTRGKDLGVSDLAKNHLVRLIRPKNVNVDLAKEKWEGIIEILEGSQKELTIDSFLYHWWLSRYAYMSSKKLFKAFRQKVTKTNAKQILSDLESDATIYRWKHETSYRTWHSSEEPIRKTLEALNLFKTKQDLPMVLSILRALESKIIKPKTAKRVLRAIECFHFIFTSVTSQRSSGGISGMYALHARDLFSAKTEEESIKVIDDLISKLRQKLPSKAEFSASFIELNFSKRNTLRRSLVHYVLTSMDSHFDESGIEKNYKAMTIEHIAPESSNSHKEEVISNIGNLILLSSDLNSSLGNKNFSAKKPILSKAAIWKDAIFESAIEWNDESVKQRASLLASLAYDKVWKF